MADSGTAGEQRQLVPLAELPEARPTRAEPAVRGVRQPARPAARAARSGVRGRLSLPVRAGLRARLPQRRAHAPRADARDAARRERRRAPRRRRRAGAPSRSRRRRSRRRRRAASASAWSPWWARCCSACWRTPRARRPWRRSAARPPPSPRFSRHGAPDQGGRAARVLPRAAGRVARSARGAPGDRDGQGSFMSMEGAALAAAAVVARAWLEWRSREPLERALHATDRQAAGARARAGAEHDRSARDVGRTGRRRAASAPVKS